MKIVVYHFFFSLYFMMLEKIELFQVLYIFLNTFYKHSNKKKDVFFSNVSKY